MGFVLLTTAPADVIHSIEDPLVNITVVLCRRLTTDIRRCRYDGLLEPETEFLREGLVRNSDAHAAVLGNQIRSQIDGTVENQRRRLGVAILQSVNELPGHIGDITEIALHTCIRVNQTYQRLRIVALFDLIHTLHRLGIRGITADAPDRIRRIENHPTLRIVSTARLISSSLVIRILK